jgi:hypothetical protein
MRCGGAFVVAALLMGGAAAAQDQPPRFDVEKYCEGVAGLGGTHSDFLKNSCFDQEQSAYDALKAGWSEVPQRTRTHCAKTAKFAGPGSYWLMKSCIDLEKAAAERGAGRKFRY